MGNDIVLSVDCSVKELLCQAVSGWYVVRVSLFYLFVDTIPESILEKAGRGV